MLTVLVIFFKLHIMHSNFCTNNLLNLLYNEIKYIFVHLNFGPLFALNWKIIRYNSWRYFTLKNVRRLVPIFGVALSYPDF